MDTAFDCWVMLQISDWKILPDSGGFLDQNERLMHDIAIISYRHAIIKAHMDANESDSN